ncbi:MAG: hypothetical protein LBI82_08765 [Dysgonamonadaceae bacterium]|jgi:hypothetical protein|nr:hypothetical protein [Dysgonamonadaceae bacterium]
MGRAIFNLIISIIFIIGGLSGGLVLRGTNSSGALVIVGFVFLSISIYRLATNGQNQTEEEEVNVNIPNSTPSEHIQRATELIEQGMGRETIFETLKSDGLVGKEISDAYYYAYNIYLKKQEQI